MCRRVTQLCVLTSLLATAIARPLSAQTPPADQHQHAQQPDDASPWMLMSDALVKIGFEVSTAIVDVSLRAAVHALARRATAIGAVAGLIHAAGVSPSQASPATILKVDLYGTALVLDQNDGKESLTDAEVDAIFAKK